MRCTNTLNESWYQTARAPRKILTQEAEIMQALTQALEDPDSEDVDNVDENIKIEDEESDLDCEWAQTKE